MPAPVVAGAASKEVIRALSFAIAQYAGAKMLDAMLDPGPKFDNPDPATPIPEQPAAQIANNIYFAPSTEISPTQATEAQMALNTMAANKTNAATFATAMDALSEKVLAETNTRVMNASETDQQTIRNAGRPDSLVDDQLQPEAAKALEKILRKSSDRWFASKEEHEWNHVVKDQRIQEVYLLAGDTFTEQGTYGNWVDSKPMRIAIETVRRLKRLSHGKNSKAITSSLGTSREALLTQLASSTEVQTILGTGTTHWDILVA